VPAFVAFDLLWWNSRDQRNLPLLERKRRLRRLVPKRSGCVLYLGHLPRSGKQLSEVVVANDLEGMVAKPAYSPYAIVKGRSPWTKIKNPHYSQAEGRHDLFAVRGRLSESAEASALAPARSPRDR
jgi:bifunctional non-homologous end joining protein LigD